MLAYNLVALTQISLGRFITSIEMYLFYRKAIIIVLYSSDGSRKYIFITYSLKQRKFET